MLSRGIAVKYFSFMRNNAVYSNTLVAVGHRCRLIITHERMQRGNYVHANYR